MRAATDETTSGLAKPAVTVIGLGLMGSALARALLAAGHRTAVWNRTPEKADNLSAEGAQRADTVRDAVEAAPLVVVCVSTSDVLRALLEPVVDSLGGRTLVNLTSESPGQARAMEAWATRQGIVYVDGAILATPQMIATPEALLLYSGSPEGYEAHAPTLRSLGAARYLGDDAGLASAYDVALLGMMYATQYGVLHGTTLLGAAGVSATEFLPLAREWYDVVGSFMPGLAREVDARDYSTDIATLDADRAALDHIVEASEEVGLETEVFAAIRSHAASAIERGHGSDSFSAIVEMLRESAER